MKKQKQKKSRKRKIQKNRKGKKSKKNRKRKRKKIKKREKRKKKKNLFSVVLDKMCVFYLYPIPDSQQYVKRGSCRRPILSRLLCLFSFWASGPFVTSFEFGPRTLSLLFLSSLWVILCFVLNVICVNC